MTPIIDALQALDRALGANEGASETQIKLQAPPYYALAKEMHSIRGPIHIESGDFFIPVSMRIGRILVLPV